MADEPETVKILDTFFCALVWLIALAGCAVWWWLVSTTILRY